MTAADKTRLWCQEMSMQSCVWLVDIPLILPLTVLCVPQLKPGLRKQVSEQKQTGGFRNMSSLFEIAQSWRILHLTHLKALNENA